MSISSFSFPTPIKFGAGARKRVGALLRAQGCKRPLIVTDKALGALPVLAEFRSHLAEFDLAVFSGVFGSPTASQVVEAAAAFKAHQADCVIGFGGGAALDVAKLVGVAATHEGDILEFALGHPRMRPITHALPLFVALPTTAGTGSEVTHLSAVCEDDSHLKRGVLSASILARAVFADPELTIGLPPAVTAATGMDALTHNVESYLAPVYHPMCEGIGLEGARIVARALRTAVREPGNLQARSDMMMASLMGGVAFQKGLGAVHALSHPLGGLKQLALHHGMLNAVLLPHVLRFNADAAGARYDALRQAMRLAPGADLADAVHALVGRLGLPLSLSEMGVPEDVYPAIAAAAVLDHSSASNPRKADAADYEAILRSATR